MWKLTNEKDNQRFYDNSLTGEKCSTSKVYQDKEGNEWWGFDNLIQLPFTRNLASTRITALYTLGLSKDDLNNHINGLKTILKSDDKEKYEKAYSFVLDFQQKAETATDAIKQIASLVCVYFLLNDEYIDGWDNNLQIKKMGILEHDLDAQGFFLNEQINRIERYMQHSNLLFQIASSPQNGK